MIASLWYSHAVDTTQHRGGPSCAYVPYSHSPPSWGKSIKLALLLNAISPVIGGVLIRGHKGTAKSTAVRALSRLLPDIEVVAGCPFACALSDDLEVCPHCVVHPAVRQPMTRPAALVELPRGHRGPVVGTLDIERA